MAQAEMHVTPEEARFLRRFFRRQALPWLVVLGGVAIAAARWGVPAADPGLAPRLAETQQTLEAMRAENAALRTELDALGQRIQVAVDRRLGAAEERIAVVERRPNGRAGDGSDLGARLARLEEQLASATTSQDTVTRSSLTRLNELETRMRELEGAGAAIPAAPAP